MERTCVRCKFCELKYRTYVCQNDEVAICVVNPVVGDHLERPTCKSARTSDGKCQDGLFFEKRVGVLEQIKLFFSKRRVA